MSILRAVLNRAQLNNDVKDALRDVVDGQPFWVDVTVTAALLDGAKNVPVFTPALQTIAQYKVRDIRLTGGGTSFGAAGDRNISLTDGTTVWTTILNANIEAAPAVTQSWGGAASPLVATAVAIVPYLTGVSDTKSVARQAIRFQYSGGTTDHGGVGSIKFSVCLEKV